MMDTSTLIASVVAVCLVHFALSAVHALYFHPLSSFPGPKLWTISRIPYLTCLNRGLFPFRIKQLHERYGPVVRIAVDELSFNDARARSDIYKRKDLLRPPMWGSRPPGVEAHSLISAPEADHARFRKALNPAFSEKSTRGYEAAVQASFSKMMAKMDEKIQQNQGGNADVDLVKWFNFTTFDAIGEIVWSKGYGCLDSETGHAFMAVLLHFQALLVVATIGYYPLLEAILMAITPKSAFQALHTIFKDTRDRTTEWTKTNAPQHHDLIEQLTRYQQKAPAGEILSDAEIEQNLLIVIVGGSETLTTVFSGAFHHLLASPSRLETLVNEIRTNIPREQDIDNVLLSRLPYLNAVIEETLRLCPPLPDALRRIIPAGGAIIADHAIPSSTIVSVSSYAMFTAQTHFSDPAQFIPERWLDGRDELKSKEAFHPFGIGSHGCLGQPLARMELRLGLAMLLSKFDVATVKPVKKWEEQRIYWTWDKWPLHVAISRREAIREFKQEGRE
ncbi:cytochrome P450 [Amniculicola lignicola CBS 123094]|uniref:Cytochrome P450 n=1 Tax=Amniculicola lignicola CBS 123094 TaxID=1392246 RepID=A0A6A5WTY7_9PLEO|nr:cytochrome P450 [Amniculicola lignicola CBS 123094]